MLPPIGYIPPKGPPKLSARERLLALWRGVDLTPLEKARGKRSRSAGDLMPNVLTELRIDKRRCEAEVVKVWNNLLEPDTIAHAQPTGLRKGTLFVTVDSSVWLDEIVRFRRHKILERLQDSFGRQFIARISYRVG